MLDNWHPLERVQELCGLQIGENNEEVVVTMPYNHCLRKEVWEINSANIVREEITLVSTSRTKSTSWK